MGWFGDTWDNLFGGGGGATPGPPVGPTLAHGGSGAGSSDTRLFYDSQTGVGFAYDPYSDVPTTLAAAEGSAQVTAMRAGYGSAYERYMREKGLWGKKGGGGGGGGGGLTPQDLAALEDRFYDSFFQSTGLRPEQAGLNFNWYLPKWKGGWSQSDFERFYRSTDAFKNTYPSIGERSVDHYNQTVRALNEMSLSSRGGKPLAREEIEKFFNEGKAW